MKSVGYYEFPPRRWSRPFVWWYRLWQRWLWWLPYVQAQLQFSTPAHVSEEPPWWCPQLWAGQSQHYAHRPHIVLCVGAKWLGLMVAVGLCIPRRPDMKNEGHST